MVGFIRDILCMSKLGLRAPNSTKKKSAFVYSLAILACSYMSRWTNPRLLVSVPGSSAPECKHYSHEGKKSLASFLW